MPAQAGHERSEHLAQLCRRHGLALTVQRRTILEVLLEFTGHPTADDVYDAVCVRIPGVSRTTVYRVLDTFVRIGAVVRVAHPGSVVRYDPKLSHHHHFHCVRCDRIIDLEDHRLDAIELPDIRDRGFQVGGFDIHVRGLCPDCQKTTGQAQHGAITPGARRRSAKRTSQPQFPSTPKRRKTR